MKLDARKMARRILNNIGIEPSALATDIVVAEIAERLDGKVIRTDKVHFICHVD